ncbi:MAG TPA: hypothetical protein VG649_19705, partial [Candidatus Angelobacter sp.]|nr:hypothetical protein [Candidatus Angelobacter sp.]
MPRIKAGYRRGFFLVIFLSHFAWLGGSIFSWSQASRSGSVPLATEDRLKNTGWWPTQGRPSASEYVGTQACGECHRAKFATQRNTP